MPLAEAKDVEIGNYGADSPGRKDPSCRASVEG